MRTRAVRTRAVRTRAVRTRAPLWMRAEPRAERMASWPPQRRVRESSLRESSHQALSSRRCDRRFGWRSGGRSGRRSAGRRPRSRSGRSCQPRERVRRRDASHRRADPEYLEDLEWRHAAPPRANGRPSPLEARRGHFPRGVPVDVALLPGSSRVSRAHSAGARALRRASRPRRDRASVERVSPEYMLGFRSRAEGSQACREG